MKLYEVIKLSNRTLLFRRTPCAQPRIAKRKSRIPFLIKFSNMRLRSDAYNAFVAFIQGAQSALYTCLYSKQRVRITSLYLIQDQKTKTSRILLFNDVHHERSYQMTFIYEQTKHVLKLFTNFPYSQITTRQTKQVFSSNYC